MKKIYIVLALVLAGFVCLAPTCNSPTASGELTSYFQTDSNIVITGKLRIDGNINIPLEAQKLITGEWATFGGVQIQVPHDSTLSANFKINLSTKPNK